MIRLGALRLGLSNRLTLTIVILVVLTQAVSLFGYIKFQQEDMGVWRLPVPVRVSAAVATLDRTPDSYRDEVLVALNGDATRFFISEGAPPGYRGRPGPYPALLAGYGAALHGRDVQVLVASGQRPLARLRDSSNPTYAISVALHDGQRLIVEPSLIQRRRGVALATLLFNLAVGLFCAFLVWRTVRTGTRGLEAIADASDRFAADLATPEMDETGAPEARRVAAAFNRMRHRIRKLMSERMRMLAAVAHDLKTFLTRLRLRAALIEDPEQRARADRDIALMAALIEDVILVARGEDQPAALGEVHIDRLLAEIVEERRALGQDVEMSAPKDSIILADPLALRRVIENLTENAVTYAGSAHLEFSGNISAWTLKIMDHGPGLGDFMNRAFEPFERGEGSRNRETGGAGLGLSIARSLARGMDADIQLETTQGGGLTAIIHHPLWRHEEVTN
jgi:signal transduction histidine kinase